MLVAAVDLAEIAGLVFDDFTGDGFSAGEEVDGAALDLFRDDGDGVFEPGAGDAEVSMAMTDANGRYRFERLTAGSYFVLQPAQTVDGRNLQRSVSTLITITAADVRGTIRTIIDSFETPFQEAVDQTAGDGPVVSILAAPTADMIGGERELIVDKTSVDGEVSLTVDDPTLTNRLSFDSLRGGQGPRRIVWDGADGDGNVIDDTGLGGVNLASNAEGIQIQLIADLPGSNATVRVYTSDGAAGTATRFSTATIPIPSTTNGGTQSAEFLPFSSFTATGGGADFTSVGAIELIITGAANVNGESELIGAVGTVVRTVDFDNFEQANLSLTKTVDDPTPTLNQQVTFTITVINAGPDIATNVRVSDPLPAGFTFASDMASIGDYNETTGIWTIGTVPVGTPAILTILGTVNSTAPQTNTAQITAADQLDPNSTPNNNVPAEDDQASVTLTPETIDLRITKTVDNPRPNVGDAVVFTVSVFNDGPNAATNAVIADRLPTGLTFVSATPARGSFNSTNRQWTIPTIADNETLTLTINAVVAQTGTLTNTAEVISVDQFDSTSTPNNNVETEDDQDSATVTTPVADLRLQKTVDNSRPNVGDEFFFTVTLDNLGPDPATGVIVQDIVPLGINVISDVTTAGVYDANTGRWTVGNIAVGTPQTLTIRATALPFAANTNANPIPTNPITNTASILASQQFDGVTANNQASVTIDPPIIDLELSKSIDVSRPNVGDEIAYTVTLSNSGNDPATNVSVRDVLPAGLTFLSATESAGSYSQTAGLWTVPVLAANANATLTLRGSVNATGLAATTTNTAEVISVDQFDPDSTPGNNVATEDDQAAASFSLASADLSITKTVDDPSPNVGDNVTFTIVVSNAGPDRATNIRVRDQLPAGATFVSAGPVGVNFVGDLWQISSLDAGSSATLTIVATAATADAVTNVAEIIAVDQRDPDSTPGDGQAGQDDLASVTFDGQQINLSLTKTIDDPTPNVGDEVTFTITIDNAGPNVATGVQVTDRLPTGVTLVRSTPSQGSFNTSTGVWTVGTVNATASPTLQLVARIDGPVTDAINVAEITAAGQPDFNSTPGNNDPAEDDQDSVMFTTPVADLELDKTVSNPSPNVGEQVTFEIVVTNAGPALATGVQVTDLLPEGLDFVSTTLNAGTYNESTGIWDVGNVAVGTPVRLSILANVLTQGTKTNVARVTRVDQFDPDSTPGNNVDGEDDQDSAAVTPPVVDIAIDKTASPQRPAVGETITFTVTVTNEGVDNASGVVVSDPLPAGLTFVNGQTIAGAYNAATGLWNIGDLASGATATLTIMATMDRFDTFTNVAELQRVNEFDDDAANDSDMITITSASANLSLTKTVDDDQPNVGDEVTFTITINNAGPDAAGMVTVRDSLPTGLNFVSAAPTIGTYNPITGIWTVGTIASGTAASLQLRGEVVGETTLTNVAEILTSNQFDPNSTPGNGDGDEDDQATASLTPQLIDLALTKVIDEDMPNVGDTIAYTLTLSNSGPSLATGVAVTDRLPDGVTFQSFAASQGSYNSATGVWTVGSVSTTVTPTLVINATVGNTRSVTNVAEVTAANQVDRDSTPGNDAAAEDDQAVVSFVTQVADLSLTKSVNTQTPAVNDVISFTLTLTNAGPNDATQVRVRDLLPAGLRFVSANPSSGTYNSADGIWSIDSVTRTSSETLQIDARVMTAMALTNTAEVIAVRQFDPNSTPGNGIETEDDFDRIEIVPVAIDLSVASATNAAAPIEGDEITLTFTTTNDGNIGATGVVTSVVLPDDLTIVSVDLGTGTYDPATGRWTIGTLGVGVTATLEIRANVEARGVKTIPVQVIEADQIDRDSTPDNNVVTEDDQVDLIILAPRVLNKRLFLAR